MFRSPSISAAASVVRVRATPASAASGITPREPAKLTASRLGELIVRGTDSASIKGALKLLATADRGEFQVDRPRFRRDLAQLVHQVIHKNLKAFNPVDMVEFVDHASNLNALTKEDVNFMTRMVKTRLTNQAESNTLRSAGWEECALSLWAASLWRGFPSDQFPALCLSLLSNGDLPWRTLTRLAWCVKNDRATKSDPSVFARLSEALESHLSGLSLHQLSELSTAKAPASGEYGVGRKAVLDMIARKATTREAIKEDNRIPSQLLSAWTEQRVVPSDPQFFADVLARCIKATLQPHAVLECVATLGYPNELMGVADIKRCVRNAGDWVPSLDQLATLSLSFASLGLDDIESMSFIANHLDQCLVARNPRYAYSANFSDRFWKIGVWYTYVSLAAPETARAALTDAHRELTQRIASGMWDHQGAFVRKDSVGSKLTPAERSMRNVISQNLASLGISALPHVHIVNTPYIADLFLPDRDLAIAFVAERDLLSDGRVAGQTALMQRLVEGKGYRLRLLRVADWERKYLEESQEEFIASLLGTIQH